MSKLWESTLTGEVLDDFGNVIEVCCDNPIMPEGMSVGYGVFGGFRAICENCDYVNVYYECACELVHDCKGAN